MDKQEFEEYYARKTGVTVEWLHKNQLYASPCNCTHPNCKGWYMCKHDRLTKINDNK